MSKATQTITVFIIGTVLCFFLCGIFADNAYAISAKATNLPKPPNAVKVVAIHEFGLFERNDIKKVTIKANGMETIEEPALYKQYRKDHHKKVKIVCKDKDTRKWLNASW